MSLDSHDICTCHVPVIFIEYLIYFNCHIFVFLAFYRDSGEGSGGVKQVNGAQDEVHIIEKVCHKMTMMYVLVITL